MPSQQAQTAYFTPKSTTRAAMPQERVRQLLMVTARHWGVCSSPARASAQARGLALAA